MNSSTAANSGDLGALAGLGARRLHAAEASRGRSHDFIYQLLEKLVNQFDLTGNVLDFGAGIGTVAHRLAISRRFKNVVAADIMSRPDYIDTSVTWISCDLNERTQLPDRSFDVIVAAEVIEHLENPRAVAREWARLLRLGGTLILSTPNNESWRAIASFIVRGCFAAFGDASYPAHITPLARTDIVRLLAEAGFQQPVFVFTDVGFLPRIANITWQTLSFGILRGIRYSDNVFAISRLVSVRN